LLELASSVISLKITKLTVLSAAASTKECGMVSLTIPKTTFKYQPPPPPPILAKASLSFQ